MKRFITAYAVFALLAASASDARAQSTEDLDVRRYDPESLARIQFAITESKLPSFPLSLKQQGVQEGEATFAIFINHFGEMEDYLLLEASHMPFADAVERVLPDWRFSPPAVDNETAAVVSTITVHFERGGGIVYESANFDFGTAFQPERQSETAYRVYGIWELDSIPEPVKVENPVFHVDLLEQRQSVDAVFEFYIDTEGRVRLPTLREAEAAVDERLLIIAQDALLQWRFKTPTANGKPVVARAAQPFRFLNRNDRGVTE